MTFQYLTVSCLPAIGYGYVPILERVRTTMVDKSYYYVEIDICTISSKAARPRTQQTKKSTLDSNIVYLQIKDSIP